MMTLFEWAEDIMGSYVDVTGFYGPQSPDIIYSYLTNVFGMDISSVHGNGYDIASNIPGASVIRYPEVGAVVSFPKTGNQPYGHCGVVVLANPKDKEYWIITQNPLSAHLERYTLDQEAVFAIP